jgi:hypothetical protein
MVRHPRNRDTQAFTGRCPSRQSSRPIPRQTTAAGSGEQTNAIPFAQIEGVFVGGGLLHKLQRDYIFVF